MQFIGLECYNKFWDNFMIIFERTRYYFINVYFSLYPVLIEMFFFVYKIKILVTFNHFVKILIEIFVVFKTIYEEKVVFFLKIDTLINSH